MLLTGMNPPRIGRCPACRKTARLDEGNPWRPFCSERCKLLDLGDWISGRFAIPVAEPDEFSLEPDEPPPPH